MAHPNDLMAQRVLVLDNGLEIWKVHVDALKEQDKNARLMDKIKFDRLKANIAKDKRLESLPLCYRSGPLESPKIYIISGHHRVRSARMAGVTSIYVLVDPEELTPSQVKAKQLAHNKQLYEEIEDQELRLSTGLGPEDFNLDKVGADFKTDGLDLKYDYRQIVLLFLPDGVEKFVEMLDLVAADTVIVSDRPTFDPLIEAVRKVAATEDIRNMSAVFLKMAEIIGDYYRSLTVNEVVESPPSK